MTRLACVFAFAFVLSPSATFADNLNPAVQALLAEMSQDTARLETNESLINALLSVEANEDIYLSSLSRAPSSSRALPTAGSSSEVFATSQFRDNLNIVLKQSVRSGSVLRIYHGRPVPWDRHASTVAVLLESESRPGTAMCSGTLVSDRLVLTAAHCVCPNKRGFEVTGVVFGESAFAFDRTSVGIEDVLVYGVCGEIMTGNYRSGDAALLRLDTAPEIPYSSLASASDILQFPLLTAVGFGQTETGTSGEKFEVDLIVSSADCGSDRDESSFGCHRELELVAGALGAEDTCVGDSGGPVFAESRDGEYLLVGVTSRAIDPSGACGPGGIYVSLGNGKLREWLLRGIESSFGQSGDRDRNGLK